MSWDRAQASGESDLVVTARCTLITPMYGGGVTAGRVDRNLPIRASALRGQLRFWWRLLNGSNKKPADLFAAESALWGGISSGGSRASKVRLRVKAAPADDQRLIAKSKVTKFPDYALVLESKDDPELLKAGYGFDLVLRFERSVEIQQREQVIEALRWWASFAGVGARTRRGLGAVKVTSDDVDLRPVSVEEVEACGGWMILGQSADGDAVTAWTKAVDALRRFRQGVGLGRNPGHGGCPGRSRWPEPDTIRRRTGMHARAHAPRHPDPADRFFPRAAFGLPLVFHFKDRGDPRDSVLNPDGGERMASPLILRPWFDGRRYRPVALLLPGWEQRVSVRVGFDSGNGAPAWPVSPDERERLAKNIEPMRGRGTDVLSAFMSYFEEHTRGGG